MQIPRTIVMCCIFFSCFLPRFCLADAPNPAPVNAALTTDEQARQLQEQALAQAMVRLDAAATFMGQGHIQEAINGYLGAFQMEPNFAVLAAEKSEMTRRSEGIQQQIFATQKQAMDLNAPPPEDLFTLKIALDGQLRAIDTVLQLQPSFAEAHANMAHLLFETGAAAESLVQYQLAIRLNPSKEAALSLQSCTLISRKRIGWREQWEQAVGSDDKDAARNAAGLLQEFPRRSRTSLKNAAMAACHQPWYRP